MYFVSPLTVTLNVTARVTLAAPSKSKQALGLFCKVVAEISTADVLVFGTSSL
jgi:hypothetical protein